MNVKEILSATYQILSKWPNKKLLKTIQYLREKYSELEKEISGLKAENAKLKEELSKIRIRSVNEKINQPSSKQPEWEEKGVGNDGKGR
jgi:regulator of replication initiation timing